MSRRPAGATGAPVCASQEGTANSGVLLRAGEITAGADLARAHRPTSRKDSDLAQGPARLATALSVDRALNGSDACSDGGGPFRVRTGAPADPSLIRNGPRTGVAGDGAVHPWRYCSTATPLSAPTGPTPRASGGSRGTRRDKNPLAATA